MPWIELAVGALHDLSFLKNRRSTVFSLSAKSFFLTCLPRAIRIGVLWRITSTGKWIPEGGIGSKIHIPKVSEFSHASLTICRSTIQQIVGKLKLIYRLTTFYTPLSNQHPGWAVSTCFNVTSPCTRSICFISSTPLPPLVHARPAARRRSLTGEAAEAGRRPLECATARRLRSLRGSG